MEPQASCCPFPLFKPSACSVAHSPSEGPSDRLHSPFLRKLLIDSLSISPHASQSHLSLLPLVCALHPCNLPSNREKKKSLFFRSYSMSHSIYTLLSTLQMFIDVSIGWIRDLWLLLLHRYWILTGISLLYILEPSPSLPASAVPGLLMFWKLYPCSFFTSAICSRSLHVVDPENPIFPVGWLKWSFLTSLL